MNKSVSLALSDLLTIHSINTTPDYFEILKRATSESEYLGIDNEADYVTYATYFNLLAPFSFGQMSFLDRMTDPEYRNLIVRTYSDLKGIIVNIPIAIGEMQKIVNQDVRHALSDVKTLKELSEKPELSQRIKVATREAKRLGVADVGSYYLFQSYFQPFMEITFEQVDFFERMENQNYNKEILHTYKQITGEDFVLPEEPKVIQFPKRFQKR